jgi:hypothetical protein
LFEKREILHVFGTTFVKTHTFLERLFLEKVHFSPSYNPDKPEQKRNWLVREIPNSFSAALITTAKDEPKLQITKKEDTSGDYPLFYYRQ